MTHIRTGVFAMLMGIVYLDFKFGERESKSKP